MPRLFATARSREGERGGETASPVRRAKAPAGDKACISAGQRGKLAVVMAHKKIERKKELDRRRKRRAERIKARIHEAQAAAKSGK